MSKNVSESTPDDPVFTAVELQTLEKLNAETRAWIETVTANQAKKADHETPAFTVAEVEAKMADLDREIKYLINKAKIHKPKPKPKAEKPATEKPTTAEENPSTTEDGKGEPAESDKGAAAEDDGKTIPPTAESAGEKQAESPPPVEETPSTSTTAEETIAETDKATGADGEPHKPDDEL